MRKSALKAALVLMAAAFAIPAPYSFGGAFNLSAEASDIKITVNKVPITSLDISHRVACLKLQRKKGNLNSIATEELIDEALKRAEVRRAGISIPDKAVNDALNKCANGNKMK